MSGSGVYITDVPPYDGDVVGDDSYYAFERYGEGWTQDDLVWSWGAPVSALTINDNVVFVNIMPADRAGERAFVNVSPFADYYHVDNRIITTPPGTDPRKLVISRDPGANQITFWGNIPLDDPGATEALAIEYPANFAAQVFQLHTKIPQSSAGHPVWLAAQAEQQMFRSD